MKYLKPRTFGLQRCLDTFIAESIVFAFSDNHSAENSKLSADSAIQLLECMVTEGKETPQDQIKLKLKANNLTNQDKPGMLQENLLLYQSLLIHQLANDRKSGLKLLAKESVMENGILTLKYFVGFVQFFSSEFFTNESSNCLKLPKC